MEKIKKLSTYLIILTLLCSCSKKDPLVGTWEFANVSAEEKIVGYEGNDNFSFNSYITFSGDNTFLFVKKGHFDPISVSYSLDEDSLSGKTDGLEVYYGTWDVEDSIINFRIKNYKIKKGFTAKITSNDGRNMDLTFLKQNPLLTDQNNAKFKYRKVDYNDVSSSKHHFASPELNKWRIKNNKKYTNNEIKSKVENALQFYIEFLEYHTEQDKTAITYYMNPSPFRFYGNGIVLNPQYQATDWNDLFYDEEEANIAYNMIDKSFRSVADIPEDISGNPIKINIFILKETLKNLESMK